MDCGNGSSRCRAASSPCRWLCCSRAERKTLVRAFVDSDWDGCRRSRKSTSGRITTIGGMVVEPWSATQRSAATSRGEAEDHILARGGSEALDGPLQWLTLVGR